MPITTHELAILHALYLWRRAPHQAIKGHTFVVNQAIADVEQYIPAYVLCCWMEGKLDAAGPTLQGLSDLTSLQLVEPAPRDFTKLMRGCWRMADGRMFELRFEQERGTDYSHVEVLIGGTRVLGARMGGSSIDPLPMDLSYRLTTGGMGLLRSQAGADHALPDRTVQLLRALAACGAFDRKTGVTLHAALERIPVSADGSVPDTNSYKKTLAAMSKNGLVETLRGRNGRTWLTREGRVKAERSEKV